MKKPLLRMTGISKRFGATQALANVAIEVTPGSVHALIGENGAGKSTLMKVLSGVYQADEGQMEVAGRRYRPRRPIDGRHAGIAMIYQELNLAPHLPVVDNIMLGQERARLGMLQLRQQRKLARDALSRLSGDPIPLRVPAGQLPIAKQQLIEIARALVSNAKVLIFDEPTSSVTENDTQHLFAVIRGLKNRGFGIVYISHFLEEVVQIADLFTVLRDGQVVGQGDMSSVSLEDIVKLMVGRDLDELFPRVAHEPGEIVLEIDGLSGQSSPYDVCLNLRRGEILGLAGLVGAGRSELLRCLFGLDAVRVGMIKVQDKVTTNASPRQSIQRGIGFVSENRKDEGLALEMSICDNLTFTRLEPYSRFGWLSLRRRRDAADHWIREIQCKATDPDQSVDQLSGGNQQKIAIARLLHQEADILLLDEPTRGIDIGTKSQIYRLIGELAAQGRAVVMVSSYLPELLNVCDRIGVMCRGHLRDIRRASDWDAESIMHCATGLDFEQ